MNIFYANPADDHFIAESISLSLSSSLHVSAVIRNGAAKM